MDIEEFTARLEGVRGKSARCPCHDDRHNSLSFGVGDSGGILVYCHAGCRVEDIVESLGLTMRDIGGLPHIEAEYPYRAEDGRLLWVVERWACPKDFRCRPGLPLPAQRVLYRMDALAWARENHATIYIVEGERDADRLVSMGLVATTNVGGAGSWLPHYSQWLAGCPVVVIADRDEPGERHARQVASAVAEHASHVLTMIPRYGKDVSEMLDLGWTLDALEPLPEAGSLGLVQARNVLTRPVAWVWPGYIAAAKLTLIEGDPGDGKSILTTALAGSWSSNLPLPDGVRLGRPISVVMVSSEDDPSDTVVPRLRVAGADLSRVYLVTRGTDPNRPFTLSRDLPALAEQIMALGVGVVTLDPLMALLGDDVDAHSDHSVRRALWPLHQLAQDTGVAVVVVRHLNKGTGKAVYRGGGSIGIGGAARAVFNVGRNPEHPQQRILSSVKMNIAAQPPSLAYTVESGEKGPYIEWHGAVSATAQEIVDGSLRTEDDQDIIYFLNTVVDGDKPWTWRDIVLAGRNEGGWTEKQLKTRRTRSRLVKITGHEGRRSTRWGYLSHTVSHEPSLDPVNPHGPGFDGYPWEQGASPLVPPKTGSMGEDGDPRGPMADTEIDPEEELAARPLACDICDNPNAHRFAKPWWVIRCIAHSPLTYQG